MTETISTPGVYTSEVDQSFIAPIQVPDGCAIVGPTQKGEAYVPTSVQSPGQFSAIFGTDTSTSYVPQTVYNYLQAGTSINVTRVLGNGGWQFTPASSMAAIVQPAVLGITGSTASVTVSTASLLTPISSSAQQLISIAGASTQYFYGYNPTPVLVSGSVVTDVSATTTLYVNGTGSVGSNVVITVTDPQSGSVVLGSYIQTTSNLSVAGLTSAISASLSGNSLNYTSSISGATVPVIAPYGRGAGLNGTSITLSSIAEVRASGSIVVPSNSPSYFTISDGRRDLNLSIPGTGLSQSQLGSVASSFIGSYTAYSASYSGGNLIVSSPIGSGAFGNNITVNGVRLVGGISGTHAESGAITAVYVGNVPITGTFSTGVIKVIIRDGNDATIDILGNYTSVIADYTTSTFITNLINNVNSTGNKGYTLSANADGVTLNVTFKLGLGSIPNGSYNVVILSTVTSNFDPTSHYTNYQGGNNFRGGVFAVNQLPISTLPFIGGVTANTGSLQVIYGNAATQALGSNYFINTGSQATQVANLVNAVNAYTPLTNVTGSISGGNITFTAIQSGSIYNSYYTGVAPTGSGVVPTVSQSLFSGGVDTLAAVPGNIVAVLHPSHNQYPTLVNLNNSTLRGSTNNNLSLNISGNQVNQSATVSMFNTDANYYAKVLGTNANASTGGAYAYLNFVSASISTTTPVNILLQSSNCTFTSSYSEGYYAAATPWVLSSTGAKLFQFVHRSHGFATNNDVKVAISNIRVNTDSTIYTTFDVLVRQYGDTDKTPVILEQYTGVTLNPDVTNYIGLVIGDKYNSYDTATSKVISHGNFDNVSNYIRVSLSSTVTTGNVLPNAAIQGHEELVETIAGFGSAYHLPVATYNYSNTGSSIYSGFDFTNVDNSNYLNPVPLEAQLGNNIPFKLPAADNKFILPFQGGTDGMSYATIKNIGSHISNDGTNVFGFDLSSNQAAGFAAFKKALDIISNKQAYKYGILVMPGIIEQYHGAVTAYAQAMVESRKDAVYLRDLTGVNESVATAVTTVGSIDSSYSATYYPWVKVKDIGSSRVIHVPPTVLVPQAIAYNDRVGAPWFAVAGTGRGTLGGAIDVRNRLSTSEQGVLYTAKINPIIKTPSTGVVIWGQKTLQTANTALNRLNVRRLMIQLKDYISTIADDFVFGQNSNASRNSLLSKINPYLQNVQQNQGITAFKVSCDTTNNSNTDTANHILNVKIQIIPTESIEFILLEFDLTAQGVAFV